LAFEDDGVVFNTKCSTTHELLISSTNIYHWLMNTTNNARIFWT
jgi:hypothetical protein